MAVKHVTTDNFNQEVIDKKGFVLVDFWADWCGPCKMLSPIIKELAEERTDISVCKVDVDANPDLAIKYKVMSIPMIIVFKDGEIYKKSIGAVPKSTLLELLA